MINPDGEFLHGGLMNTPKRIGDKVYRQATESTATIHRLLTHARNKGIAWVPEPISLDSGTEVLSFIKGEVPHDMPGWIWGQDVLTQIATHLRDWHDATTDFNPENARWNLETGTEHQVICHNDFAPYNCVFREKAFVGLIDFDLCAPGSRLWDMSYTAYRFIPVMPAEAIVDGDEKSPFDIAGLHNRMGIFLKAYSGKQPHDEHTKDKLLSMIARRLTAISEWTRNYAKKTDNDILMKNAAMYKRHSDWVQGIIRERDSAGT